MTAKSLTASLLEHRRRAARVLPDAAGLTEDAVEHFRHRVLPDLDDEHLRSVTVALAERTSIRGWAWEAARLFPALEARRPVWTAADVGLLFDLAHREHDSPVTVLRVAVTAAEGLDPAERELLAERFRLAQPLVDATTSREASERAQLLRRLVLLADTAGGGAPSWAGRIRVEDGWSHAAVEHLRTAPPGAGALGPLLDHALAVASGPRPTKTWLRRTGELLDGSPELVALLHDLLHLAHSCRPATVRHWYGDYRMRVSFDNADLVRGLLWAAQVSGEAWLVPLVLALEPTLHEPKPLNACYAVLGRRADDAAIAALVRMQRRTRHRGKLKQITAALDEAAAGAGVSRSELTELTIPDCGLDPRRQRRLGTDDLAAVIAVDDRAKVRVTWEQDGATTTKPPASAGTDLVAEVRRAATDLKQALAGERVRLEDLLAEDREWPLRTWRERYVSHPVTGSVVDRLLWTVSDGERRYTGLPDADGRFTLADGSTVTAAPEARIRLWHPVDADPEQVRAWREHILAREVVQPFKQAFREVYLLTPAEEETRVYSNRFAAHILRYQQAYALMKERRWGSNYLGGWDGGHDGEAKRDFPAAGLTAVFHHEQATDDGDTPQFCSTDRVRFERGRARARQDVALAEVPARVFSEAMRDVDLFVGVTSIATDPTWADGGTDDARVRYWRSVAFGDLTANGQVRRQVLEHLLPKLKIRDRARLDGHYLVVDGRRHTYRIHIGSGNILMSPNDRYLCIVPSSTAKPTGLRFLPFEGDTMLAIVLSKALLLADDHKITDPSILHQLG
ncbi:DUF4132 domain-containing protein [Dactylosporangium sp. NBC_01737]|uniref:DUF4132 domain-containing protein n=1 Tax=Dactylosporangium sp. NBC_01737 TaxID=2975959 RepID=UPI002E14D901|nr:DUF4132 domain-containing protein [Dactylosporangium sp. NBC_01737]